MPSTSDVNTLLANLPNSVPAIFQQAQLSLANHRKNVVALHRLHAAVATIREETDRGTRLVGEKAFNDAFLACLNRVLDIKRGVSNADRCIKFVAAYSTFTQTQFRQTMSDQMDEGADSEEEDEDADTPATRFVTILIRHLLRGFGAKNKNVRLRCCQTIALLINGLESLDDDLYETLKNALLIRMRDKEAPVRVHAIIAMAKLQGDEEQEDEEEEPDYEDEERQDVTSLIIRAMRHDPSAEVRRAALFNLVPTPNTFPYVLERLRDTDTVNRRCVYLGSLSNAVLGQPTCKVDPTTEDWAHIVKVGLGDRESSVVRATKKLIASWTDAVMGSGDGCENLLDRFNLTDAPEAAKMTLKAAFEARPALLDTVNFNEEFWQELTPSKALIARVFAEHCKTLGTEGERRMEETMPLVTALAFRTQAAWGTLLEQLEVKQDLLEREASEEEQMEIASIIDAHQSIVESLLHVSMHLDYGDEIGRRKMFNLVRDMVSNASLPEALIEPCLDVLRKLSAGQKDFVRIIVELVQEIEDVVPPAMIHDSEDEDEAEIAGHLNGDEPKAHQPSPSPEQVAEQALIDAHRLSIMAGMLERIVGGVQEMTAMQGLVSQLITPSVQSKYETVRDRAYKCLGLCCLMDANLALSTFGMFLHEIGNQVGKTRQTLLQVLFDQLTTHGITFLCQPIIRESGGTQEAADAIHSQIVNYLLSLLEDDDKQIQAFVAEGMAKLMLSGIVTDDDALRSLILVYMAPETSNNQQLRQCLSYFLPIYCYSSATNQRRLQRVLVPVLDVLTDVYFERENGQEMVSPLQIGLQLLDWCDPAKGVYANKTDVTIHIDVAIEIVQALFLKEEKEDRKVFCQLLSRLIMPDQDAITNGKTDDSLIAYALFILIGTLQKVRPLEDAMSKNNLAKFQLACKRLYPTLWSKLQGMDIQNAPELDGVRAFVQECGFDPTKKLDKGDDGTIISELDVRKGNSASAAALARRTISATSQSRRTKVKSESDEEVPTIEQSIMEEDEEEEDYEEADATAETIHALAFENEDLETL
ncbi:uncharacterized protein FA14DRAFT_146761 [Meira miltonrushii]|uniref:Nuclear condensin complex subunit 3 C-terminal domain-containing protein n=1 Tax=Meira miltonrushii TaxID=1280837 RepID=A0A316VFT3_9BASI|nr:uncharacterized protein FA14DRAFT_146761 [Meira miltonrushii]PWN36390.1 hypothetical protein FA14DRAFT_146761 [Meira miltonrushii]